MLLILVPQAPMRNRLATLLQASFSGLRIKAPADEAEASEVIGEAEAILSFGFPMFTEALAGKAARLRWVQSLGTGVDGILRNTHLGSNVVVTATRGIQGPHVSEGILASMLALSRDLPRSVRNQALRRWERWPAPSLHRRSVAILGVGDIATSLALRCKAFGMRVTGISRTPRPLPGFDEVVTRDSLIEVASKTDYLVLLLQYEAGTRHLVDRAVLKALRPDSFLVNVARGGVVDEEALIEILQARGFAGAALDVFETEPLPPESRIWEQDNVIVTCHQGGYSTSYAEDSFEQIAHNIRAFLRADFDAMTHRVRP